MTEDSVGAVEACAVVISDVNEELACCRVWLARLSHGDCHVVVVVIVAYFIMNCWNVDAVVFSALNHEAGDYSLEDSAVVEPFFDQIYKVGCCNWFIVSHLDDYVAHGCYEKNLGPAGTVFAGW